MTQHPSLEPPASGLSNEAATQQPTACGQPAQTLLPAASLLLCVGAGACWLNQEPGCRQPSHLMTNQCQQVTLVSCKMSTTSY